MMSSGSPQIGLGDFAEFLKLKTCLKHWGGVCNKRCYRDTLWEMQDCTFLELDPFCGCSAFIFNLIFFLISYHRHRVFQTICQTKCFQDYFLFIYFFGWAWKIKSFYMPLFCIKLQSTPDEAFSRLKQFHVTAAKTKKFRLFRQKGKKSNLSLSFFIIKIYFSIKLLHTLRTNSE